MNSERRAELALCNTTLGNQKERIMARVVGAIDEAVADALAAVHQVALEVITDPNANAYEEISAGYEGVLAALPVDDPFEHIPAAEPLSPDAIAGMNEAVARSSVWHESVAVLNTVLEDQRSNPAKKAIKDAIEAVQARQEELGDLIG